MTLVENFNYYNLHHSVEMADSFQIAVNPLSIINFLEPSPFDLFSIVRSILNF